MELTLFSYREPQGWSVPALPAWDSAQTLVIAFAAPKLMQQPEPLAALRAAYPGSCLIGCSTAGEIHGDELHDDSLSGAVLRFQRTTLRQAQAPITHPGQPEDSFRAGESLASSLAAPDLRAVFVLSDGLSVNGSQLVAGMRSRLPHGVILTGGLAADGPRFQRTFVLSGPAADPAPGQCSAVGLYGSALRVGHGSEGGWDVFGPERVITRSQNNVLYEMDGQPALSLYKRYLGERAAGLPATALLFPLSLRENRDSPHHLVRTILSIDEEQQSMTFAGDVPEGSLARLMRAHFDRLVDGAGAAAETSVGAASGQRGPLLAVAISCVGRRLTMGERTEEELAAVQEALPPLGGLIGYYSYGELSPSRSGAPCELHNQTMTLTTFAEEC